MQTTSQTYQTLIAQDNHWFESCLYIGPTDSTPSPASAGAQAHIFREEELLSVEIVRRVFSNGKPEIGCCVAGEIQIEMLNPEDYTIPRMAKLVPYTRVTDGTTASEWIQKGVFYVDTRERTENTDEISTLSIHGYDDMLKAGQPYYVRDESEWPKNAKTVVQEIAATMGVTVHPDTFSALNTSYLIPNPEGYTYREALGFIAGMHAGNFILDDLGRLKLIWLSTD